MLSQREKYKMLQCIQRMWDVINEHPVSTPCADCNFYKSRKHQCEKANNEIIPEEIRKKGCKQWKPFEDQELPF